MRLRTNNNKLSLRPRQKKLKQKTPRMTDFLNISWKEERDLRKALYDSMRDTSQPGSNMVSLSSSHDESNVSVLSENREENVSTETQDLVSETGKSHQTKRKGETKNSPRLPATNYQNSESTAQTSSDKSSHPQSKATEEVDADEDDDATASSLVTTPSPGRASNGGTTRRMGMRYSPLRNESISVVFERRFAAHSSLFASSSPATKSASASPSSVAGNHAARSQSRQRRQANASLVLPNCETDSHILTVDSSSCSSSPERNGRKTSSIRPIKRLSTSSFTSSAISKVTRLKKNASKYNADSARQTRLASAAERGVTSSARPIKSASAKAVVGGGSGGRASNAEPPKCRNMIAWTEQRDLTRALYQSLRRTNQSAAAPPPHLPACRTQSDAVAVPSHSSNDVTTATIGCLKSPPCKHYATTKTTTTGNAASTKSATTNQRIQRISRKLCAKSKTLLRQSKLSKSVRSAKSASRSSFSQKVVASHSSTHQSGAHNNTTGGVLPAQYWLNPRGRFVATHDFTEFLLNYNLPTLRADLSWLNLSPDLRAQKHFRLAAEPRSNHSAARNNKENDEQRQQQSGISAAKEKEEESSECELEKDENEMSEDEEIEDEEEKEQEDEEEEEEDTKSQSSHSISSYNSAKLLNGKVVVCRRFLLPNHGAAVALVNQSGASNTTPQSAAAAALHKRGGATNKHKNRQPIRERDSSPPHHSSGTNQNADCQLASVASSSAPMSAQLPSRITSSSAAAIASSRLQSGIPTNKMKHFALTTAKKLAGNHVNRARDRR